jgi:sphingolipid 4-desaturase/C4-monooxygenase
MGEDGVDTDLPTRLELICLNNVLGKVFFACVFPYHII